MKLNKKVLAVTAILAVGILAGCGSSNSTAGSAASAPASGVESSAASSEAAGEMGDVLPIDAGDLNEIKTGSYKFAASITKVADGQATLINLGVALSDAHHSSAAHPAVHHIKKSDHKR